MIAGTKLTSGRRSVWMLLLAAGIIALPACSRTDGDAGNAGAVASQVQAAAPAGGAKPYQVADGNKVDKATLEGWRTWRALACERCHGKNQEGMVGPSLLESLKTMSKDEFKKAVLEGRPEKGMPNFNGSKMVTDNIDGLYGFLKGRSDGAIKPGRVEPME